MRKLYGSTSWRRVLALVLVFVMMLSTMGTSGYSVFAEDLSETGEEVVVSEPEAVAPEVTEDIQGPSPGEEAEEVTEPVLEAEEGEEPEEAAEAVEEAEEGEELEEAAEAVEETEEGEETEEPAEAAEEAEEEGEEPAEPAEEAEEGEEAEEPEEEPAEEEESSDPTLIEEAAQIIEEDDGEPAPEEEAEEPAVISENENGDSEEISENFAIADVLQLVLDVLAQDGEAALEELPEEELPEEPEVFFTETLVKELSRITVTATPSEGAFMEEVELVVVPIPAYSRNYKEAEAALEESGVDYDGMLVYDISFRSVATGEFVEPAAPVSVEMEITDKALAAVDSDNMDVESLVVTHVGSEETAAVADTADETDGSVTVSMSEDVVDGISAEFVVDSFSLFILSWTNQGVEESATIHWGTYDGEEFTEFDSTTTVDANASSVDLAVNISGYYYTGGKYKTADNADGVVLSDSVIRKDDDGIWWADVLTYDDDEVATEATVQIADGSDIYVYYAEKGSGGYTPPTPSPTTLDNIAPDTEKQVTSNGDGTYKIRLDVTGHATEDTKIGANVIVMLDMTFSMRQNDMNGTRIAAAKSALLTLINELNPGYDAQHPDLNLVNFTLATFGNTMSTNTELSWTQNRNAMETAVRGLSNSPGAMGTNWQGGLEGAEDRAADANNDETLSKNPTYVIFVTDGAPNCWRGHTSSSYGNDLDPAALPYAQTAANSLAGEAIFYGVFCGPADGFDNLANMVAEAHGAGTINGTNATAMHDAFSQIAGQIVAGMAAANVTVDDGIPSLSNVSANVTAGEAGGFKYYIKPLNGEETEWVKGATGEGDKGAPGATYDESNGVTWDLGEVGTLQDGWIYSIEFTVWPSQEAYDTIADLNNGVITMTDAELKTAGIGKNDDGTYYLLTNTHLNTTFTDPSGHIYDVVEEDVASEAMPLPTETIGVQKIWNNLIDQQNPPGEIELILTKDGAEYLADDHAIYVSKNNDWTVDDIYISLGQITQDEDGYSILEAGHDYEIVEFVGENGYRWELTSEVYHPMVINNTATLLVKDDSATGEDGEDYYTINGHKYKLTSEGGNMLRAWNDRRSWLQLEKMVTGEGAPEDALFEFTVTIVDPNGEDIWYSAYGPDGIVKDLETNGIAEDGDTGYFYASSGSAITMKIEAGWTVRFLNLPSNTTYTIEETGLPAGFAFVKAEDHQTVDTRAEQDDPEGAVISGSVTSGTINVPNVEFYVDYTNNYEETEITVTKVWADGSNQDGNRPDDLTLTLNGLPEDVAAPDPTIEKDGNNWTYTWSGLPKYIDGEEATYTVSEEAADVPDGYEVSGSPAEDGETITNTYTPETTTVTVTKVWEDNDNQDGIRPSTIRVQLMAGDEAVGEIVLPFNNGWSYTWENLPKNANGVEIAYTVAETTTEVITGTDGAGTYKFEVSGSKADGFTVTNIHTPEIIDISATKVWDDADNQDGKREDVTFNLLADGKAVADQSKTISKSATGEALTVKWTDLPVYADGEEIEYTVEEAGVENGKITMSGVEYTVIVEGDAANGFTITNSYTPEETEVTVTKVWEDDYKNVGKTRPESISVQLKAGEENVGDPVTLPINDEWTYTWTELPKYAGTTTPIAYTVDETEVPAGYEKEVKQAEDGSFVFTITNKYVAEPVSVDPPVKKVFTGTEDLTDLYDKFTFTIVNTNAPDGVPAPMPENTSIKNSAKYERKDMPGYYEFGVIEFAIPGTYTYTVTESGSAPCVTNDNESTKTITFTVTQNEDGQLVVTPTTDQVELTFTNEYADVKATVTKVWDDKNDQDGKRPKSITVTLNNGDIVTLSEENKWSATIDKLPKYDAKHEEIVYTWTEGDMPEGYSLTNTVREGEVTTLTNSYTPGTTSVSGFKTWNDEDNQDGKRPESITVNLLADGTPVQSKTVTAEDGWAWNFTGLPEYNSGTKITYKVEEAAVEGYEAEVDGYNITNTHAVEKIDVTVTKIWSDYNNGYGTRPQSITVQLYANGEVCGDPVTITAEEAGEDGNWTYTYTGLDKYSDGEEIVYTVTEDTVARYTTTIEGLVITNSYVRSKPEKDPKPPVENPDPPEPPIEEEPDEPVTEPDEPFAGYEEEPDEEIGEEPMPFSPYTGDDRHTAVWGLVSLLSLAGIVVVARKRREE